MVLVNWTQKTEAKSSLIYIFISATETSGVHSTSEFQSHSTTFKVLVWTGIKTESKRRQSGDRGRFSLKILFSKWKCKSMDVDWVTERGHVQCSKYLHYTDGLLVLLVKCQLKKLNKWSSEDLFFPVHGSVVQEECRETPRRCWFSECLIRRMSRGGEGPLGYSCPCQSPPAPGLWTCSGLGPPAESPLQLAPRLSFIAREPGASDIVLRELSLRTDSAADTNKPSSRLFDGFTGTEMASSLGTQLLRKPVFMSGHWGSGLRRAYVCIHIFGISLTIQSTASYSGPWPGLTSAETKQDKPSEENINPPLRLSVPKTILRVRAYKQRDSEI